MHCLHMVPLFGDLQTSAMPCVPYRPSRQSEGLKIKLLTLKALSLQPAGEEYLHLRNQRTSWHSFSQKDIHWQIKQNF